MLFSRSTAEAREDRVSSSPVHEDAVAFTLRCLVQFLYADGAAAAESASAPFSAPSPATVEVVSSHTTASSASSGRERAHGALHACGGGVRITSLTAAPAAAALSGKSTHPLADGSSANGAAVMTVAFKSEALQRHGKKDETQTRNEPRQSVVRAVRRVARDSSGTDNGITRRAAAPTSGESTLSATRQHAVVWLPFSSLHSLEWDFCEASQRHEGALESVVVDADPSACSSTLSGISAGRSAVEVRLRCMRGSPGVAGIPPELDSVVLYDLACADALSLVDAYDAVREQANAATDYRIESTEPLVQPSRSRVADSAHAAKAASWDGLSAYGAPRTPHSTGNAVLPPAQPLEVTARVRHRHHESTPLSAAATGQEPPLSKLVPYSSTDVNGHDSCNTVSRNTAPFQHTRSISFTSSALLQDDHDENSAGRQRSQVDDASPLLNGEAAAYNKYAQLFGVPIAPLSDRGQGQQQKGQQRSRRSPAAPHTQQLGLPSPSSFAESLGSGLTSATYTPVSGTSLQFPRRDSTALTTLSPEENESGFFRDPLAEPAAFPYRPSRQGGDPTSGGRRVKSPATLPGVVDVAGSGGPRWFPAAPALSDVSEVTVSSTNCSAPPLHDATPRVQPASSPLLVRRESQGEVGAVAVVEHDCPLQRGPSRTTSPPALAATALQATEVKGGDGHDGSASSVNIVFPPLPSTSTTPSPVMPSSLAPSPTVIAATSTQRDGAAAAMPQFEYLTPAQRQLVDFDQLLRPVIPPPSSTHNSTAAFSHAAVPTTRQLGFSVDTPSLRPPAMLDQILLKLRNSSLPSTTAPAATKPGSRSVAAPAQKRLAGPAAVVAVPSSQAGETIFSSHFPSPAQPDTPVVAPAAHEQRDDVSSAAPGARLVNSYHEVLQQMRERRVHPSPQPTARLTAPTPLSPQHLQPHSAPSPAAASTGLAIAAGSREGGGGGGTSGAPRTLLPRDTAAAGPLAALVCGGDAMPHRAHGPFAQPTQHPSNTFLGHGGHRASASPPSSPHRVRRPPPATLTAPENVVTLLSNGGGEVAGHLNSSSSHSNSNHSGSGVLCSSFQNGSSSETSPSSPWRTGRTRPGKESRCPQSPPQMLPRRPEPLIGTPKLGLDQAPAPGANSPSLSIGTSLLDDEGKASPTSMAT